MGQIANEIMREIYPPNAARDLPAMALRIEERVHELVKGCVFPEICTFQDGGIAECKEIQHNIINCRDCPIWKVEQNLSNLKGE